MSKRNRTTNAGEPVPTNPRIDENESNPAGLPDPVGTPTAKTGETAEDTQPEDNEYVETAKADYSREDEKANWVQTDPARIENPTVNVEKLQELEPTNDGEKFTYGVGLKDESGLVTLFDNGGTVFYGTQQDADGLRDYAERQTGNADYEIVRIG